MAWLTAQEALAALQVRPQTLYANVSRGRIAAKQDPRDPRRSLYSERDVQRVAAKRTERKAASVAAKTIGWGEPILSSAVSTIVKGRLFYRGRDVAHLASSATLEDIAALLWQAEPSLFSRAVLSSTRRQVRATSPPQAALLAMAEHAARAEPIHGRAARVLHLEAVGIVDTLVRAFIGEPRARRTSPRLPVHEQIVGRWKPRARNAADAIRRALVLLADHELNASTFTARVTASTGASLAASVLSGLATLSGPLHGGAAASLRVLFERTTQIGADRALREWLDQGRSVAGFGHPLYPAGDLRAAILLDTLPANATLDGLRRTAERVIGEPPNVDFALAAMTAALRLPADAPFVLFATARSVGWIAHALEQSATGHLIRPRARYIGPPVETLATGRFA